MRPAALSAALLLAGCAAEPPKSKTILGAVLLNPGSEPVDPSVVVISGTRVQRVGTQAETPIPAGTEKIAARGKWLIAEPPQVVAGPPLDPAGLEAQWDRIRKQNTVIVPRLTSVAPDRLDAAIEAVRKLNEAGHPVAASPGSDWKRECELLRRAGLTPEKIWDAATVNAARASRGESGGLRPDRTANLWLLAGDPRRDPELLAAPERVMKDGEWTR